jgi:DNA-binding PadR family transcriptional regulator
LYTALERLRADGLIEVDREEIVDSRSRRYYRHLRTALQRALLGADGLALNETHRD